MMHLLSDELHSSLGGVFPSQNNQTINAAPGMDAREVANQSSAAMKDFLSSELRAAYPAATR
jgi:hypothetical protein